MVMHMRDFDMVALIAELSPLADEKYRDFNLSLTPGVDLPALGIRVPLLRVRAKALLKGDWRGFLEASRDYPLFEARMLHAVVLGGAKCPVDEKLALVDRFLPTVDNWAVCDALCSSFKPRPAEREAVFGFACRCAGSDIEFRKRFGLVMLMSCYRQPPEVERVMAIYRGFSHPGYYARMGAAWGLATLYLFRREDALAILRDNVWDPFTHNKAIQKLRESFRVSEADKRMLAGLRRRTEP